jgi:uncharacterized protein YndB with AHSA1/START domain
MNKTITVETIVNAPVAKVWECWTRPEHITGWAFASDDWEAPAAENDLRVGGAFKTVMAARDKSASFDFRGTYGAVKENELIEYEMEDGRRVRVEFKAVPGGIKVNETFDPENQNSPEMQRAGWQAILDNFRKYTESHSR